ncbi:MAG TPA: phosphatase PAP2 family protein [Acidimicrobiales bacterium]|nr:phosphatase PAP2 family protein [Acidimicrobiales bacterium]
MASPIASRVEGPSRLPRLHRADLALYRRATEKPAPHIDRVLYPLSRAANHSKLWIGVAALLAARGGRANRRAAIRGMLSVGATSALTNALIKPVAARRRPAPFHSAWLSRVARVPASASFPSGHAASAAAFAVGVSMEAPHLAAPLGLAATAVGWSRVRTRVHYPGDVLAGFAIGTAVAYATRRIWPLRPGEPAAVRPTPKRIARAETDGAGLTVVFNPAAGSARNGHSVESLREELPHGSFIVLDEGGDLLEALETASKGDVIGIVGGDGSVNAAASVALRTRKTLAVFPGGTLNHFARDLRLESFDDTIEAIRSKSLGSVDVGLIDGKPFLNTASFGAYAALVDMRESHEERLGKWLAMAVALINILRKATPVDVTLDGTRRSIWLIFIGNSEYGPAGLAPSWRERLDDGLFDVRYVEDTGPYSRLRLIAAVLTGQLTRTNTYTRELLRSIAIESHDGPLRLARDGETFDGPSVFTIEKSSIPLSTYVLPKN